MVEFHGVDVSEPNISTQPNKRECQINIRYIALSYCANTNTTTTTVSAFHFHRSKCIVYAFSFRLYLVCNFFDSVPLDNFMCLSFSCCFLFGNHYCLSHSCMSASICCCLPLFGFMFVLEIEHVFAIRHHHHHDCVLSTRFFCKCSCSMDLNEVNKWNLSFLS